MNVDKRLRHIIGQRLKAARLRANANGAETQLEAAEAAGIPVMTLSAMEHGKSLTPENLAALARHYRVSLDYVFGRTREAKRNMGAADGEKGGTG